MHDELLSENKGGELLPSPVVKPVTKEIRNLRRSLTDVDRSLRRLASMLSEAEGAGQEDSRGKGCEGGDSEGDVDE